MLLLMDLLSIPLLVAQCPSVLKHQMFLLLDHILQRLHIHLRLLFQNHHVLPYLTWHPKRHGSFFQMAHFQLSLIHHERFHTIQVCLSLLRNRLYI